MSATSKSLPLMVIILLLLAGGLWWLYDGQESEESAVSFTESDFVSIGTGGVTGLYYLSGGAICNLINQGYESSGLRCAAESTDGSVSNVHAVMAGELVLGMVQSDVQWKAVKGEDIFTGKQDNLRALMSLYPETVVLVARMDSGINRVQDIRGKRINLGNPGSGQRATSEMLLKGMDMSPDDLALAGMYTSIEQGEALREGRIDAFFFTIGHPNDGLKDIFFSTEARIVPLEGAAIDSIVDSSPYYVRANTPGGLYRNVPDPVPTLALVATLVTSLEQPEALIYNVVRDIFNNLETFKKMHPAYGDLTPEGMLEGLSAPLHPGAKKYYQEIGLLK